MTTTEQTTDTTYNGWTNYETWLVNLWLSNDEGIWTMLEELASRTGPKTAFGFTRDRASVLADELPDFVNEYIYDDTIEPSGLPADLIGAALSRVNWGEMAESYCADFPYTGNDDDDDGEED